MSHVIRLAATGDSASILAIYAPYVRETAISFETDVPTVTEFEHRVKTISDHYPYLVYRIGDEIVGFAYASQHSERNAYRYNVEVSIYVLPQYHGCKISHALYGCLFAILTELGYRNAYAGYTVPNEKSMNFHRKFGFTNVGTYHQTGYKFGRWHDVTWLEKTLNSHVADPGEPLPVHDLPAEYLKNIFSTYVRP